VRRRSSRGPRKRGEKGEKEKDDVKEEDEESTGGAWFIRNAMMVILQCLPTEISDRRKGITEKMWGGEKM